jgi:hypothetical protein
VPRRAVLAVAALAMAVAACGGSTSRASENEAPEGGTSTRSELPRTLQHIEAGAEDVADFVPHAEWNRVRADVAKVTADWETYRGRAGADGATPAELAGLDGALGRLRSAADAQRPADALQASNDVSAVVVELYALYDPPEPVDLGRLDVVGRQIALDVGRADLAGAAQQVERARAVWGGLRANVMHHDGKRIAARMDATIMALQRAVRENNGQALHARADAMLERVDDMERLYSRR